MKWPILLAAVLASVSALTLGGVAESASLCQSHRTVAVGKHPSVEADARKQCYNKLKSKGFAIYGSQNGNPASFVIECVELGGGGPAPAWKTYYQCICSGFSCKKLPFNKDDPDLEKSKPKSYREPGLTRIPGGSFGARRGPSSPFRAPSMGPKIQ